MKNKRLRELILIACYVAFLGAYVGFSLTGFNDDVKYRTMSVVYMIPVIMATIAVFVAAFRVTRSEKRFWVSLAAAMLFFMLGELYWAAIQFLDTVAGPSSPSIFDVLSVLAYVFLYFMLVTMARFSSAITATKAKYLIDVLIGALFAGIVVFVAVARPLLVSGEIASMSGAVSLIYPILDIGLIVGVLANVLGFKIRSWSPWEKMISVGIIVLTIADIGYSYLALSELYEVGVVYSNIVDVLWMTMYFLFFFAAINRLRQSDASEEPRDTKKLAIAGSRRLEVFIYALILANMPFFLFLANKGTKPDILAIIIYGAILGLLIIARAIFVVTEHNRIFSNAIIDPVTGTYNYRFFQQKMLEEIDRAARHSKSLSVAFLDLDDFSRINAVYGYSVGDSILTDMAAMINEKIRISDLVCRIGGDEFCILMPETQSIEALKTVLRIQSETMLYSKRRKIEVFCSVGITAFPQHGTTKEELEKGADAAMSWAKFHGKNQVAIFDRQVMDTLKPHEKVKKAEELAYMNTVQGLAAAVDARDPYTQDHSRNVAVLAKALAKELRFPEEQVRLIETAALLHDVGKIGIADNILKKPGSLTPEERIAIQEHPILSRKILAATSIQEILPWIGAHHERWDGQGYPNKLKRDEIPIEARILAICDVYDAMISDRPYRKAIDRDKVIRIIRSERGAQFDAELTDIFLKMIEKKTRIRDSAITA